MIHLLVLLRVLSQILVLDWSSWHASDGSLYGLESRLHDGTASHCYIRGMMDHDNWHHVTT